MVELALHTYTVSGQNRYETPCRMPEDHLTPHARNNP
jgi:hypothetical protein